MKVQKLLQINKLDKFIYIKKLCTFAGKKFSSFKTTKLAKDFFLKMTKSDSIHMSVNTKGNYMLSTTRIHHTLLPILTNYLFVGMEDVKQDISLWLDNYLKNYNIKSEEKIQNNEIPNNKEKKSMSLNLTSNLLLNSISYKFMVNNTKIDINDNNYICVSDLCKIGSKRVNDYATSTIVKKCLSALSIELDIKQPELLYSTGNRTYCHPRLLPCSSEWIFSSRNTHLDIKVKNECKQQISEWLVLQKIDTNVCANMKGTGMYKNGTEIMCSTEDGFVDATQACKLYGKIMYDYMKKVGTKKVLDEIAKDMNCDVESLMRNQDGHTFVHPKIMIMIAIWLSPEFGANIIGKNEISNNKEKKSMKRDFMTELPKNFVSSQFMVNDTKININNNNYICVSDLCKIGSKRVNDYTTSAIVKSV